jgi:fucose permease
MAALGIVALISTENHILAFTGVILCGLGLATLSPRITAAAGKASGQDTSALTRVIALSTVGNFAGPPALGTIAAILGLPFAMAATAVCSLLVSLNARAVDR